MLINQREFIANLISSAHLQEFIILENLHKKLFDLAFTTTETNLYQIKLQWYLNAIIDEALSGVAEIDAFKQIAIKYNFKLADIVKFITSYQLNTEQIPFKSSLDLINYTKNSEGSLWLFYATILNIVEPQVRKLIVEIGSNYGSVGVIRNIDFYLAYQRYILAFQADTKVNTFKLEQENLQNLLLSIKTNLIQTNQAKKILPKAFKPILLLNLIVASYLKQIAKENNNYQKIAQISLTKIDHLKIFFTTLFSLY